MNMKFRIDGVLLANGSYEELTFHLSFHLTKTVLTDCVLLWMLDFVSLLIMQLVLAVLVTLQYAVISLFSGTMTDYYLFLSVCSDCFYQ